MGMFHSPYLLLEQGCEIVILHVHRAPRIIIAKIQHEVARPWILQVSQVIPEIRSIVNVIKTILDFRIPREARIILARCLKAVKVRRFRHACLLLLPLTC